MALIGRVYFPPARPVAYRALKAIRLAQRTIGTRTTENASSRDYSTPQVPEEETASERRPPRLVSQIGQRR